MSRTPGKAEEKLVGNWVMKDGSMIQDDVCERIQWLTTSYFEEVEVNGDSWSALYKDPADGSYWELTYPKSNMHGGGSPQLSRIVVEEAKKKYRVE